MMGFNHEQDPYHTIADAAERCQKASDSILYGLLEEQEAAGGEYSPVMTPAFATSTSAAATPVATPDLQPCASASQSRSSSFSLSRSSSFSVPALSATASPSLAEVFLRGPSTEKAALQQYLMGLADTVSASSASGGKRKRKSGDDKRKRKARRTASGERTKKTAERANATAQRTKATVPETAGTTTPTAAAAIPSPVITQPPIATATATSTPVVSSPALPYSSPSLYFSSMPSPCSSFSSYAAPTLPSTPGPSYYYPNVLFDAPTAQQPTTMASQPQCQPQYEDDFWLDVESVLPSVMGQPHQHQHQQRDAFFNSSFCELERFLLEHDF